jgi:hypothetical protein
MDFLYLQRRLGSRPCREVLYTRCTHIMRVAVLCLLYVKSPPPPNTLQTKYFYFLLQVFFKDTLYFLYVLPPVLFTLTQVVLLLITSTFTRVQIESNLGTTGTGTRNTNVPLKSYNKPYKKTHYYNHTRLDKSRNATRGGCKPWWSWSCSFAEKIDS